MDIHKFREEGAGMTPAHILFNSRLNSVQGIMASLIEDVKRTSDLQAEGMYSDWYTHIQVARMQYDLTDENTEAWVKKHIEYAEEWQKLKEWTREMLHLDEKGKRLWEEVKRYYDLIAESWKTGASPKMSMAKCLTIWKIEEFIKQFHPRNFENFGKRSEGKESETARTGPNGETVDKMDGSAIVLENLDKK